MLDVVGATILVRAGLLKPVRPDRLVGMALALARWGITPATGYAAGAARTPDRAALVDDLGVLTFREVDRRSDRIAASCAPRRAGRRRRRPARRNSRPVRRGRRRAEQVRRRRALPEHRLLARPAAQVLDRGRPSPSSTTRAGWPRSRAAPTASVTPRSWEAAGAPGPAPERPKNTSRPGHHDQRTTGAPPRGAARQRRHLSTTPCRRCRASRSERRRPPSSPRPVFHAWGPGPPVAGDAARLHRGAAPPLRPRAGAASIEEQRATALVVVPGDAAQLSTPPSRASYDLSSLRIIASSGSALPGRARAADARGLRPGALQPVRLHRGRLRRRRHPRGPAGRPGHGRQAAARRHPARRRRAGRRLPARASPAASSSAAAWPSAATPTAPTRTASTA
jgi:hypothetical protein